MKNLMIIAGLCALLLTAGCNKRITDRRAGETKTKSEVTEKDNSVLTERDKSKTTITEELDTEVTLPDGKPLEVILDPAGADTGDTHSVFENDDVRLDITFNKATNQTKVKGTSKGKTVPVKGRRVTEQQNDIKRKEKRDLQRDSSGKSKVDTSQLKKQSEPAPVVQAAMGLLHKVAIAAGILVVLALALKWYLSRGSKT